MNRLTPLFIAGMILAGGTALAQDPDSAGTPVDEPRQPARELNRFEDGYGVLTRNNIFVRDRRPQRPADTTTRTAPSPPPPVPEKDWQLIGVVFEDGRFRAYLENLKGEPTTRAAVGDPIATGVIDQVFIDAIAYQVNGQTIWIEIGQDLTGSTPSRSASASASSEETSSDTPPESGDDTDDSTEPADPSNLSVEEQMRLRRQQEDGR